MEGNSRASLLCKRTMEEVDWRAVEDKEGMGKINSSVMAELQRS